MDDTTLFTAHPANDGTDTVVIRVDAKTALQLGAAWDYAHVSLPVNAAANPRWHWDVRALRSAATDATVLDLAAMVVVPLRPTQLRLVEAVKSS